MRVVLEIEKGPDRQERAYVLERNGYRVVGRAGGAEDTMQILPDAQLALEPEDFARIEEHLARRPLSAPLPDLNARLGSFRRAKDILLADEKISRAHAMFFLDADGPSVVDLGSTNGTYVNGERATDADLFDGDLVNVGATRFVVHFLKD